jgi:hypothetical protein
LRLTLRLDMSPRHLIAAAGLVTALAPAGARAADTTVSADPAADQVTALDGTIVWVTGKSGAQTLMRHTTAGDAPVTAAPKAKAYRTIDLGHNAKGRLVLTYLRCRTFSHCTAFHNDMAGHHRAFKSLALRRCSLTTAPAMWGARVAYGLACHKGKAFDARRSGLYVKRGSHGPRRLPLPKDAVKFGANQITSVDLRGVRVGAVAADIFEYAFSETVAAKQRHSFLAAASEGDSDEHARGLALGTGTTMWSLVDALHAGDPNESVIFRATGGCVQADRLSTPAGPDDESSFIATDVAVDGPTLYLVEPGTGIVAHPFVPERPCGR